LGTVGSWTTSTWAGVTPWTVLEAAAHTRGELVDRFSVPGPRALQGLRQAEATVVVPWPASGGVVTLVEALRIVLMEATVHLLDVLFCRCAYGERRA
jgi:hypothetical protein